jgi:hypothetical protein
VQNPKDKIAMLLSRTPLVSKKDELVKSSRLIRSVRRSGVIGFSVMALSMLAFSAQVNLVANGEFSLFTSGGPNALINCGGLGCAVLQNWTNTRAFTAVYGPNAAELIGAIGASSPTFIWGPKNGAPNNFTDQSPNQMNNSVANFLSSDSDPNISGTLTQTINGLVPGDQYVLSYFWAAGQYTDVTGPTFSGWTVTLGSQRLVDGTIGSGLFASIPSQGFSGWNPESVTFTYNGSGNILSFLAVGSPTGLPPVALLDSVSLVAAPEPASPSLLGLGLLGLVLVGLRRGAKSAGA